MNPPLLIVANGPSADTREVATAVTQAPLVMRMNRFLPGRYLPARCDIWGSSLDHRWRTPPAGIRAVWWTAQPYSPAYVRMWPRATYETIVAAQPVACDRIAPQELIDGLYRRLQPKAPSTGLILVAMAVAAGYAVTLAGFDHFCGERFHYYWPREPARDCRLALDARKWHNPELERALIARLAAGLPLEEVAA
jgi:hypothetical protein